MAFKSPHVALVSFSVEIGADGMTNVMLIETDLHLNARPPGYDAAAVQRLVRDARDYLAGNADQVVALIRLVSNRGGQT
ncbi:hypothetical protein J6500_11620 [Bradyrhizobium sp. WSM 1704]|uniref:hypothetical protein n=1 Tax=Bradyrhizobium semiaridum TaxID=2821404 RepID=UPI001CE2693C|nr:hypothetical protein [Bradyrhizobium semiaridum]MCA6122534.1 hypothetical protein [Bradyrhizobium semiaridum]